MKTLTLRGKIALHFFFMTRGSGSILIINDFIEKRFVREHSQWLNQPYPFVINIGTLEKKLLRINNKDAISTDSRSLRFLKKLKSHEIGAKWGKAIEAMEHYDRGPMDTNAET